MRPFNCILILLFHIQSAAAQVSIHSLQALFDYAEKNSPVALQANLIPSVSKQDVRIQSSSLYPKVNAYATEDYYPILATQLIPAEIVGGQKGTYYKAQFGLPYAFATGVEIAMPVINFEKWTQLNKAKEQQQLSEWSSKLAIENLHLQLIQAYYQYLVTNEVEQLNDENAKTSKELVSIMKQRSQEGVVNPSDYNRARMLDMDVQTSSANYDKALVQSLHQLKAILNIPQEKELLIEDSLSFSEVAFNNNGTGENRAAWQEAWLKEKVAMLNWQETKNAALPKLNFTTRYAYNMQTKWNGSGQKSEFDYCNVNLRLDFPLYQGSYYKAYRQKAKLNLDIASIEKEKIANQISQQQSDWQTQYQTAVGKQSILKDKIAAAADNLRIARLSIKEGVMEFDDFNNIFMDYNRARMEQIQNTADCVLYYLLTTQKF